MKERFHVCVVAGGPPARGTLADAQSAESIAKRVAGILAASIAMENQSSTGMPTTHGRIEDSARQAGIAGAAEPPSEPPTGALVQHNGEKAPPTTDWEIGDVADPDLIGARGDAGPQAVGMLAVEPMQPRIRAVDLHDPRAQAGGAHQARYPAPADGPSHRPQRAMDAGTAVGSPVLLEEPLNPPLELPVLRRVATHRAPPPGVIAGSRDPVQRAQSRHRVLAPLRVDERERSAFVWPRTGWLFLGGHAPPAAAHAPAPAPGVGGSRAAVAPSPPPASRGASRRARPSATATA